MSEETSFADKAISPEENKEVAKAEKKKRKAVIDSKAAQWIAKNIKTKKNVKAEDGSNTVVEVRTRAFGNIQFKGATRNAKAKFVQLSDDTPSDTIYTLLRKAWKMEQPQLLVSVTGGAKIFNMDPRLKRIFATGLRRVAQTPGTWIITGGTNTGVMKHVGEALQGATKSLIGIATWGIITNRKILRANIADAPLGDTFSYQVQSSLVTKGAFLDHNHTHFLLVHDGSQNKYGVEIPLRSGLEKYIMDSGDKVASVVLVLEGGPNTLSVVHGACNGDTPVPVVVIKGSGRAADLLAYAHGIEEKLSEEKETGHEGLQKMISEIFPEMNSEEKRWDMYLKVCKCMERKEFITIFQMSGDADVDEAILSAVLKTHQTSPLKQLQFTMLWNRADLARNLILSKIVKWNDNDLEKAMIMALALGRVDFVELLLHNCVSIHQILSQDVLEFLYGYRSRMSRSSIRFEINQKEYSRINENVFYFDTLKTLCAYENIDPQLSCLPYRTIKRLVRIFSGRLITRQKEEFHQTPAGKSNYNEAIEEFEYPYRELFFWAVLNNMHDMALFLWGLEEEGMAKGIIGAELNNKLAIQADVRDLPEELRKSFLDNSACLSNLCYPLNPPLSSVQQLLNDIWTGALKTREMSARYILLAIFFPPIILQLDFRNEIEMKKFAKLETLDEDDEDVDDIVLESPRPLTEVDETSGSDIQLIDANKSIQNYDAISTQQTQDTDDDEMELPFYKKLFEFYFKIPMVKFYTNVMAYLIFLCLFTYVAMLKKDTTTPGIAEIILIVFVVSLTLEEIHQMFQSESVSMGQMLKEHFSSIWNAFDVAAVSLFFIALGLRLNSDYIQYSHLIYAIDAWVWILRLLHYFYAHRIMGPYVLIIGRMFIDMCYFISILLVFLVAYGVLTKSILNPQPSSYMMLRDVFFHPYFNIYGELFIERDATPGVTRFGTPIINNYAEPITWFFLGFYLLIANVLLLNLLIAIFGNTFTEVQEKSDQIWKFERHDLILEYALRPSLVPPFIILEHIYLFGQWLYSKIYRCCNASDEEKSGKLYSSVSEAEKEELAEFQMEVISEYVRNKSNVNSNEELESRMEELTSTIRELKEKIETMS